VSIRVSSYLSKAMVRLDRRDYEAVFSFLAEAHAVEEPAPFTPHLLDRLASLACCELATFFEYLPGTNVFAVYVPCSNEEPDWRGVDDAWWTCTRTAELRRAKARSTGLVVLADIFPRRLRANADFNLNYRQYGVVDEIGVSLDRDRHWTAELGVFGTRDFSERQRLIFRLLRPHLAALYRAAKLRRQLGAGNDATRRLTRRERDVMKQVGKGLTNTEIGRVLVIEPSTVRKHLEHIFEKLGVGSRTAALAALRGQAGDPPAPTVSSGVQPDPRRTR
jgi:DNA-binding CsgD family transcriptional regulator